MNRLVTLALLFTVALAPAALAQQPTKAPTKADSLTADLFLAITNGDVGAVKSALKAGADINRMNWLGMPPLTWAAGTGNLELTKLLVARGANVHADTIYGSALTLAGIADADAVGVYLLSKGAKTNPPRFDRTTPLMAAAAGGCAGTVHGLLKKKASLETKSDDGGTALVFAARRGQVETARLLLAAGAKVDATDKTKRTPLHFAALDGNAKLAALLLSKGASVKAVDGTGSTPLNLAARYSGDAETVRLLLAKGADASRPDGRGKTPYQIASLRGHTAAAELLTKAAGAPVAVSMLEPRSSSAAITPALTAIQISMKDFKAKAPCVACHHQGLALMTIGAAAKRKYAVDGQLIGAYMGQLAEDGKATAGLVHAAVADPDRAKLIPAVDIGDFAYGGGYIFGALHANGVPANPGLAEPTVVIGRLQKPNGSWQFGFHRGTMQHSNVMTTAMTLDLLNAYWPADRKGDLAGCTAKAKAYLLRSTSHCAEDRAARLWGLKLAGGSAEELANATRDLLAAQQPDGGWSGPAKGRSDAYATGVSLFALRQTGTPTSSEAVRRAVDYLLRTQDEDGTWYAQKVTGAYNNHFDSSFPHGYSQYASLAATCWATLGLLEAAE